MTGNVLKQDPNTERFKRTLIYYDTDTQYANFRGNPLRQTTKIISVLFNLFVFGKKVVVVVVVVVFNFV